MIPQNITKASILEAISIIDNEGVPKGRESTKYNLKYNGKLYPPKYVVAKANKIVNSSFLESSKFNGGNETNKFLEKLGFEIVGYNKEQMIKHQPTENHKQDIKVGTVTIQSEQFSIYHGGDAREIEKLYKERLELLDNIIRESDNNVDILILSAGYLRTKDRVESSFSKIEEDIKQLLSKHKSYITVCIGVDGREGIDQIGLAINNDGIIGSARKFYPTDGEKDYIKKASNYLEKENGFNRVIDIKGKKLYMAICYDVFGIRKLNLDNPGVDGIINLVHIFNPKGLGGSDEVRFAKCGFGGASKVWNCKVFGAVTFFAREIPERWPTGVLWNQGDKNVLNWKYTDNGITYDKAIEVPTINYEKALVRVYSL